MLRNIVSFIFIYIFIISCDNSVLGTQECSNCMLELTTELEMDESGQYHLDFNSDYIQTFARINAQVGHDSEYVGWTSNGSYCIEWNGFQQCSDLVNNSSYSGSDGVASTILGVHSEHIGYTVKVYCGYYDDYGVQHLDSLEVIIDE